MTEKYDVTLTLDPSKTVSGFKETVVLWSCYCPFDGPDGPYKPFSYCNWLCQKLFGEDNNGSK